MRRLPISLSRMCPIFVLSAVTLAAACDVPGECSEPTYVRVAYYYECTAEDEQVTLSAWGPRFLGGVIKGCESGTINIAIDEPGEWHVEAKTGVQTTVECDVEVTDEMIADRAVIHVCDG